MCIIWLFLKKNSLLRNAGQKNVASQVIFCPFTKGAAINIYQEEAEELAKKVCIQHFVSVFLTSDLWCTIWLLLKIVCFSRMSKKSLLCE